MYDELIERIRKQCINMDCSNCNTCVKQQAADAIEELVAAVPKWHPVSDPPKDKGEYIVAYYPCEWDTVYSYTMKVGIDTFRGKTTWAKKKYQRVIYWMEKPNPPKEVE